MTPLAWVPSFAPIVCIETIKNHLFNIRKLFSKGFNKPVPLQIGPIPNVKKPGINFGRNCVALKTHTGTHF